MYQIWLALYVFIVKNNDEHYYSSSSCSRGSCVILCAASFPQIPQVFSLLPGELDLRAAQLTFRLAWHDSATILFLIKIARMEQTPCRCIQNPLGQETTKPQIVKNQRKNHIAKIWAPYWKKRPSTSKVSTISTPSIVSSACWYCVTPDGSQRQMSSRKRHT